MPAWSRLIPGVQHWFAQSWDYVRIAKTGWELKRTARDDTQSPVVLFNASTRLLNISQNAAFQLLASWGLQAAGVPTVQFVCRHGLSPCVLGTNAAHPEAPPPCERCIWHSQRIYAQADVRWFGYQSDADLTAQLEALSLSELATFEYQGMPLGELVMPSGRWKLRRHHLVDDPATRYLLRQYILSAWNVAEQFKSLLDEVQPQAVVVFNGLMYPEAAARWVAKERGMRVITHEVGLRPFSAFFTEGQATIYPIDIPNGFELSEAQNARLDDYLQQRFQGNFTMAGITFWPEMKGLDAEFLQRAAGFKQIVPVFTNVVFDTSQMHANIVFDNMFEWLDTVLEIIKNHPETLFVIRAHPDEMRPGKQSRESVQDWVKRNSVDQLPNVAFVPSDQYLSSYELIRKSKFVMVYNSSIGLEAAIMGSVVLSGGAARYTLYPIVYFPQSVPEFRQQAEEFLQSGQISAPDEYRQNARKFLYWQLFVSAPDFSAFLREAGQGYVYFRHLAKQKIIRSDAVQKILQVIVPKRPVEKHNETFV